MILRLSLLVKCVKSLIFLPERSILANSSAIEVLLSYSSGVNIFSILSSLYLEDAMIDDVDLDLDILLSLDELNLINVCCLVDDACFILKELMNSGLFVYCDSRLRSDLELLLDLGLHSLSRISQLLRHTYCASF